MPLTGALWLQSLETGTLGTLTSRMITWWREERERDQTHIIISHSFISNRSRVAYMIFLWGDTHISAASRGSGGMLPQKIFCILRWTLT